MANQGVNFQLTLVDKLSGPAKAGASALKQVEKQMKSVRASSKAIVGVKPITVAADKGAERAAAKATAQAEKAALKERVSAEKAAAKAILAQERQLQAEKKAMAKAAAAEWRAIDRRNVAQSKAGAKAESAAAKEVLKAQKAAGKEAAKLAKQKAADTAASGEAFASQAAMIGTAASAAAVAVLALAAAFAAAAIGGASLALSASEAKGDTLDMLEAMLGTEEAAVSAYDAIQDITREVAISQSRAQELAQSLTAAGVTNRDMLLDAVKSIGQVESVIKGAGDKVQSIIETANTAGKFQINAKKLVGTGVQMQALFENIAQSTGKGVKQVERELKAGKISAEVGVAALTKTIDQKFGKLAAGQTLDFGAQMQRLKDNFGRLFEDVNTGPFLNALKTIVDLFDESTSAGKMMKETVTAVFDGLFSVVAAVAPYIKTFFKGLIIIALQAYIGMKPLLKALGLIGSESKTSGDGTKTLASAMATVGNVVRFVTEIFAKFLAHKPILIALGIAAGLMVLPFILTQIAVTAVIAAFVALLAAGAYVVDWLLNLGAKAWEAGTALVDGLINGITGAAGKLIDTVKNLGGDALKAFKSVFKISSPSRVMMGVGENISLGLAEGIMSGGKAVNDNMTAVVDPASAAVPQASSKTTASSSVSLSGVNITIEIHGVQGAADLEARMPEIMANALEQAVNTLGFQPAA